MKASELKVIGDKFHENEYIAMINEFDSNLFRRLKAQAEVGQGGIETVELPKEIFNAFEGLGYKVSKNIEIKETKNIFGYIDFKSVDKPGNMVLFV